MIFRFKDFIKESSNLELSYWAFDIDDNLLHMPTVIHMDKMVDGKWVKTDVSTSDFATVRNDKENYRLIDNNPSEAFCEFRDNGIRGDKAFIEDLKKAISLNEYGPSWDAFMECLSKGEIFSLITARGHEPLTFRKGVEYIIDNVLTEDQKYLMYNNCLKHSYLFGSTSNNFERVPKGEISKTKLVSLYLDCCDYYGISSDSFKKEFGEGNPSNPEVAKEQALNKFIEKCNSFGANIGAKSVSIGFSDDDAKNIDHVKKFFKEKSSLSNELSHTVKLSTFQTTDRTIKGGEVTKFKINESQSIGMESSIMPFSSFNSITNRLTPSLIDNDPVANTNRSASKYISKQSKEWLKGLKKHKKPKLKI